MTLGLAFWVIMLIWLIFGVWSAWPNVHAAGGTGLLFVLLFILGWAQFGPPIKN